MDKPFIKRVVLTKERLDDFLCLMLASIKDMLFEKTDRVLQSGNIRDRDDRIHDLDAGSIQRLGVALSKIEGLRKKIKEKPVEGSRKEITVTMDMICSCPIHIRRLEEAGIVTLGDLVNYDPFKLIDVLRSAEEEAGGIRYHHLYCCMWYTLDQLVDKALKKYPGWKR